MHLSDGELRLYIDQQLAGPASQQARQHLADCAECQARLERLTIRAGSVSKHLAVLAPSQSRPAGAVMSQFKERMSKKEIEPMWKKLFSRPYRPAWAVLGVVVVLALALSIPSVSAIANNFLGLFRVQQVTVVQVNPANIPQHLGSSSELESLLSQDVQVQKGGQVQSVTSAEAASQLAGIPVRLPTAAQDQAGLVVQPASHATFKVETKRIQAILDEIGRSDIQLPAGLDGSSVEMDVPAAVAALYGPCQAELAAAQKQELKPSQVETPGRSGCTTLVQLTSPTVSTPPGLDIKQIGQAFLEVLGMSPEDAAHFSQNIDWATTLVVPIPRYGTSYQDVTVDGVNGTFIQQDSNNHGNQYLLMWVKDGIVYALSGPGDLQAALAIGNSLK